MGSRGPKPKPLEVLKLEGSKSAYKRKGEPASIEGDPDPPSWLSQSGRAQWDRMVARMRGMQFLSPGWRESLAQFCEAWSEYESLVVECQGKPFVVTGQSGAPYLNPIYSAKSKAWDRVLKMGREFGYTPASKADIKVEKSGQETGKKRFFEGA